MDSQQFDQLMHKLDGIRSGLIGVENKVHDTNISILSVSSVKNSKICLCKISDKIGINEYKLLLHEDCPKHKNLWWK